LTESFWHVSVHLINETIYHSRNIKLSCECRSWNNFMLIHYSKVNSCSILMKFLPTEARTYVVFCDYFKYLKLFVFKCTIIVLYFWRSKFSFVFKSVSVHVINETIYHSRNIKLSCECRSWNNFMLIHYQDTIIW
jgi:hypothetical protein